MKLIYKAKFHSIHCSMMFRRAKIWSMQSRPFRNPACSCLSFTSKAQSILLRRTLQKTLLGMDRSVMPRQLSQLLRSPFIRILDIRPLLQSLGMVSWFQILAKRSVNTMEAVMTSALSNSACSELIPGVLPLFIALTAVSTSAWEGGLMLMSVSSEGSGSTGLLGSGRLSTSSKCWTHYAACSLSIVNGFPCLSLTLK